MKTYHNTTGEKGSQLDLFVKINKKQDQEILDYFKIFNQFQPSVCWSLFFKSFNVPLTSVRRSINTLTKAGYLIKTTEKKPGMYGRPEYVWKISS